MKAVLSLLSVNAFDVGSSNKRLDTKLKVQFLQFLHCSADILVILCVFLDAVKSQAPILAPSKKLGEQMATIMLNGPENWPGVFFQNVIFVSVLLRGVPSFLRQKEL